MIEDILNDPHRGNIVPIARVIVFNNKKECLLLKREKHPFKGYWEVVGGKVEFGERHEKTAERELFEETGMIASPQFLGVHEHIDTDYHRIMFSYFVTTDDQKPKMNEHNKFGWFGVDKLPEMLIPQTKEIIELAHSKL